jgi:CRISPR-associated endonuclease Cas1
VLTLTGYGLRLRVERGHLIAEDGAGRSRRSGRFSRVSPELRRLIVVGRTGSVSLDALSWLRDTRVSFVQLDHDGALLALNGVGALNDVRVRRGQAIASASPGGLAVARALLTAKVEGQRDVLRDIGGRRSAIEALSDALDQMQDAGTLADVRYHESRAAAQYWEAWAGVPIRFATHDCARVPDHWHAFDLRRSLLSASPRKASQPINALLNYLYGIVEAEATMAALRVGCDPAMGLIHTDRPRRASFACDLMEPVRPQVDAFVLQLLESHTFRAADFFETVEGNCRLMPPLTAALAETAPRWAKALGPVAERSAAAFLRIPLSVSELPRENDAAPVTRHRTPLTQGNRRKRPSVGHRLVGPMEARCKDCGCTLANPTRHYCDACLPIHAKRASQKAVEVQRQLRAIGEDKRQSPEVRALHATHAREQARMNREWEAVQTSLPSPAEYSREIRPGLSRLKPRAIADATGLSISSAKTILAGRMTPHPRHWPALRALIARG